MKADDERAAQWREAIGAHLLETGTTKADLARALSVVPQAVDNWLSTRRSPPEPDVVFAIEDALVAPGKFAPILGYRRAPTPDPSTLRELLEQDPNLSRASVAAIIAVRDTFTKERRGASS